eukprot:1946105-Prymnesium_polylepis.1
MRIGPSAERNIVSSSSVQAEKGGDSGACSPRTLHGTRPVEASVSSSTGGKCASESSPRPTWPSGRLSGV